MLQDDIPERDESLLVNITSVRLANEADRQGSTTDSPRVNASGQFLQLVIRENDNNRGLLHFSVQSVEVMETFDSQVTLQVVRTRGTFGAVSVEYGIVAGSASSLDYTPLSNSRIAFVSGQEVANITIGISNDQIPEQNEMFEVILRNSMGGAQIGTPSSLAITILSNDDINGVFFFADTSLLVSTSIAPWLW